VYGRREKRGREAGFPKWREVGEKGKNYATLRNISQSKKCKGAGTGIKGYGKREVKPPCPPPYFRFKECLTLFKTEAFARLIQDQ